MLNVGGWNKAESITSTDLTTIVPLDPLAIIGDIFEEAPPQEEYIHIIVQVLDGVHREKLGAERLETSKKLDEILKELKKDSLVEVSMSRVTITKFREFLRMHNLYPELEEIRCQPTTKPVSPFCWGPNSQSAQMTQCIEWFRGWLNIPDGLDICNVSCQNDLLNCSPDGTTNLVVVGNGVANF